MCVLWHTIFNAVNLPKAVSGGALAIMSALVMAAGVVVVVAFRPATLSTANKVVGSPGYAFRPGSVIDNPLVQYERFGSLKCVLSPAWASRSVRLTAPTRHPSR